jgi:hypothetical protein
VKTNNSIFEKEFEKTAYRLANNYFRLWYLYIYMNQAEIQLGSQEITGDIIRSIMDKEAHEFHIQKAFKFVDERLRWKLWAGFRIMKAVYSPQTVSDGDFSYTFDAINRNGEKAVFVKVFDDPLENCKEAELAKIQRAMMLANKYYDSHVFIFSKRRFCDYAVSAAAKDEAISLVEVDRLKF